MPKNKFTNWLLQLFTYAQIRRIVEFVQAIVPAKEGKMAKKDYQFMLDGVTFDLSDKAPLPLKNKTGAQIAAIFNEMCLTAANIADFDPMGDKTKAVAKFRDVDTGVKRIAALHSSIVAHAKGQEAEKSRAAPAAPKAEKAAKAPKADGAQRGRPALQHPSHKELFDEYNQLADEAASLGITNKKWKRHTSLFEKRDEGQKKIADIRAVVEARRSAAVSEAPSA